MAEQCPKCGELRFESQPCQELECYYDFVKRITRERDDLYRRLAENDEE